MSDDNLEPLVTQCPNCETRFRVNEAQLQVAAGRVRCGACLTVFEGTANLIMDGETLAPGGDAADVDALLEELEGVGEQGKASSMPDIDNDDLAVVGEADIGSEEAAVPDELAQLEAQFLEELRSSSMPGAASHGVADTPSAGDLGQSAEEIDLYDEGLKLPAEDSAQPGEDLDQPVEDLDQPIAEPLGVDLSEPEAGNAAEDEFLDAAVDAAFAREEKTPAEPPLPAAEPASLGPAPDAEAAPSDLTPGDEPEADRKDKADAEADLDDAMVNDPSAWLESVTEETWQEAEIAAEAETAAADSEAVALEAAPPETPIEPLPATAAASASVDDEAYDLELSEPERRRSWMTLALSLLLIVGLPVQVLWFQYDTWVKDPDTRPIYEYICTITGCELPPLSDVSLIASKKSFIRAHPERADARIVDVLMVNNADFAQPYPLIELTATSLRGQLIAGRRFKPEEYLQGDARPSDLMPPKTPVHVSLEIQDPGEQAMNFEVRFR